MAKPGLSMDLPATEWLTGSDGRRLATSWYPARQPWLNVLLSHGFAEHRGWWHHVAAALQANGVNVLTYDQYAHGQSDGVHGDIPNYGALTSGMELAFHGGLKPRAAGLPIVILAHSNGGLIALMALPQVAKDTAALVLCSPLIGVPWPTVLGGWPVAHLIALRNPAAFWPVKMRPQNLTHHQPIWHEYHEDPLRFHRISARFFLAMVAESRRNAAALSCGGLPLLLLSAGEDVVVSRPAMAKWFAGVPSPDKQRRLYPDRSHELFNEADWTRVLDDVLQWLNARFRPTP